MGITASENFSSKSVNFAVSKSVRRGLNDNVDWFISPHCDKLEFEESDQLMGAVAHGDYFFLEVFLKSLCLFHCVPLYVCRLCINFQDLCARLLGVAALRILLFTFTSRFVIDFLSIRKVIIFSAIATDDRHPLRSRSIHQNAANCMRVRR